MTNQTPRAIAYLRVSTDTQTESGLGLDAQRAAIAAAAARQGVEVGATFADQGVSGAAPLADRPGLSAAIDALRRGDVLLVAKRDRLGRDLVEVALIERLVTRKRCRVLSAAGEGTDTVAVDPAALLQRRIADVFAEYERGLIAQRTRAALRAKRARGERAGNVPFGYQLAADGVRLEPAPEEQRVLRLIAELRLADVPLRRIADTLNAAGCCTRRGTAWRHQYVAAAVVAAQQLAAN